MASKMMSREQQGRGLGKVIKRGRERKSKKASVLYSLFPFQLPSKISLLGHPCPHPGSCALPRFSSTSWQSTATVCPTPSALMPGGRWGRGVLVGGAAPRPGGLALGPCGAAPARSRLHALSRDALPLHPACRSFTPLLGRPGVGVSDGGR